jgi:hypothetical protein
LRHWTDPDGAFCFAGRGLPEDGAALLAALAPHQEAVFAAARAAGGERERPEAHAYDALLRLAITRPTGPAGEHRDGEADDGPGEEGEGVVRGPAKVIVHVDLTALRRGHTQPGERCEIAGVGPVAVAAARDLLGDAFLALVVADGVDIRNVTHLGRAPTAHQRTALEARGRVCAVPGCGRTTRLEIDHVQDWAVTRRTHVDHLDWLCAGVGGHHSRKTHDGWTLTGPPGNRTWHPPPHREGPATHTGFADDGEAGELRLDLLDAG